MLEKREVKYVVETALVVLRQELMRLPSQAITDLRSFNLPHDQLHAIRTSADKTVRNALGNAVVTLKKALSARTAYMELTGQREPSPKAVAAARRKKERANANRSARRKGMIPIDRLVEIWLEVRKPAPSDDDLSWWREACRNPLS